MGEQVKKESVAVMAMKRSVSVGRFDLSSLSHDLPDVSASGGE